MNRIVIRRADCHVVVIATMKFRALALEDAMP
jgi:hypothetical protein